ncbi:MAG: MFS transporter [Spirochaetota bacterium]
MAAGGFSALFMTVCSIQPIFQVYLANHLGAPASLLGLLFGFMLATGALQLVSVFIYRALPRRKTFFIVMSVIHRFLGLGIAASAFLFLAGRSGLEAARLAALALAISWVFMSISTSGWLSWMADLVPEDVRGSFFLRRSAVFQSVTVLWFFAASVLLDLVPESGRSFAYAAIFGIGALGGMVDILLHVRIPEPAPPPVEGRLTVAEFLGPLGDLNFLRYSLGTGIAVFAVNVAAPFQAPRITDPAFVGAPNVWLGIMTVITILAWVAMAPLWGFVMDRYGRKPAVVLGCLVVGGWLGYFFIDHGNYSYILPIVALFQGFFGPALWEGAGQLMLTLAPPPRRVVYIAWFNTIVGLVAALGPVAGGQLMEAFGARSGTAGSNSATGGPFAQLRALLPGFDGFSAVHVVALAVMVLAVFVLRGVREGRERPIAGLITQMASAGLFRTYASLLDLRRHAGDPRVARALRRIDGDEGELVVREVIGRLDDPEPEVREEAIRALGRIGGEEARDALESRLLDLGWDLRVEAARVLGRLGDPASLPALEEAMREGGTALRTASAQSIGALSGGPGSLPLASILSAEHDHRVLDAAALGAASRPRHGEPDSNQLAIALLGLYRGLFDSSGQGGRRQYVMAMANLLGDAADFAPYLGGLGSADQQSGGAESRAALFDALEGRLRSLGAAEPAMPLGLATDLALAVESGKGIVALRLLLDAGDAALYAMLGPARDRDELSELVARADTRLGAWDAVARACSAGPCSREAEASLEEPGLLLALLGAWFLSKD